MESDNSSATGAERDARDPVAVRSRFARNLAMGGFDDVHVLSTSEADEVLTPRRREVIEALSEGEYSSVRALARALDRDKGAVSKDLALLAEHDVVTYEDDGRSRRPVLRHATVVVEPVVARLREV